jgi:hypothetical protein
VAEAWTADEAGLDTVWVGDHLIQAVPGASSDEPMLEAFTHARPPRRRHPAGPARHHGRGRHPPPDIPDGGATLRRKLTVLSEHCARVGRPVDQIEKSVSTWLDTGESAAVLATG